MRRRKVKEIDENILKEEVAKHFRLLEYTFYTPEEYTNSGPNDLILGEEGEEDEVDTELDVDLPDAEVDSDVDMDAELGDEEGFGDEPAMDEPIEPAEEEVEVDISDLVKGGQEAKASIDNLAGRMEDMMNMYQQLNDKVDGVSQVTTQIADLENELEKRMPTEEEKLEMRSLDSYPYNLKLTDYWADKEGKYDVLDDEGKEGEEQEYVLTQKDVEDGYDEKEIRDSLTKDDYDEEEI